MVLEAFLKLPEAWECNLILIINYKRVDILLTYCTRGFCVQENPLWLGLFLRKSTFNAIRKTEQFQEPSVQVVYGTVLNMNLGLKL